MIREWVKHFQNIKKNMKRIWITGSRRTVNEEVTREVRSEISAIIQNGDGIITGGALGVDFIATDTAMTLDPTGKQIKIFLPTTVEIYDKHMHQRAEEWVITLDQADTLTHQLKELQHKNPQAIIENTHSIECNEETYYARNTDIVNASDEIIAFHVNASKWTQDTIDKAKAQGKKIKEYKYTVEITGNR